MLAFIHKNILLLTAVLSCYDSERNFGKVQIFPMKVEMLLFASVKLRRLPEQKAASEVLVSSEKILNETHVDKPIDI